MIAVGLPALQLVSRECHVGLVRDRDECLGEMSNTHGRQLWPDSGDVRQAAH